jgi:hypothetical protein
MVRVPVSSDQPNRTGAANSRWRSRKPTLCWSKTSAEKTEKSAKPQVGVSSNRAFARHDFVDALRRHADFLGQQANLAPVKDLFRKREENPLLRLGTIGWHG